MNKSFLLFIIVFTFICCQTKHTNKISDEEKLRIINLMKNNIWLKQVVKEEKGIYYEYTHAFYNDSSYTHIIYGDKEYRDSKPYYLSDIPDSKFKKQTKSNGSKYIIEQFERDKPFVFKIVDINDSCLILHNLDGYEFIFKAMPK